MGAARHTIGELAAKMDALGVWKKMLACNFALRPHGVAVPYFCSLIMGGDTDPGVKCRLLFLEGWQTMHDYVRTRMDREFGYYLSPYEMPHYEIIFGREGPRGLFRNDPGLVSERITDEALPDFVYKMIWEAYGVMIRLEEDPSLALRYADSKAMFSRAEGEDGKWADEPLEILAPMPYVEKIAFPKAELAKAKDLPMVKELALEFDFRVRSDVVTKEKRPKLAYELRAVDAANGRVEFAGRMSVSQDFGLKDMWQAMPVLMLKLMVARGRVPGEIRVKSGRVFRLLRGMCIELPLKLSINAALPALEKSFRPKV